MILTAGLLAKNLQTLILEENWNQKNDETNIVHFQTYWRPGLVVASGYSVTSSGDKTPSDIFQKSTCHLNLPLLNHMTAQWDSIAKSRIRCITSRP